MVTFEKEMKDITGLKNGDVRAFTRLYQQYHRLIHANILKLVKDPEASSEILQDAFFSLWQNRNKISVERPLGGWLFVVSYNMSLNYIRKELKESLVFVDEYPADLIGVSTESQEEDTFELQMQLLQEAVSELPKRKREVFRLCRYEGKTKKDVADSLGLSLRTVDNYLKEANRRVKEHVWEKHPEQAGKICLILLVSTLV